MPDENLPGFEDEGPSWHVLCGNDRLGPYRLDDLFDAISKGAIKGSDLIWRSEWTDWRQCRAIAGLWSFSLANRFDYDEPALPAAPAPAILAHKLELKLRPNNRDKFWFEQLNKHHVDLAGSMMLIGVLIGILAALSTLIFGNSREGVFCIISEFVILFLICVRAIGQSMMLRISSFRFAAPLAIAGLLLIAMNGDVLPDAIDAWQGKRAARNLHTLNQIELAAQEHPSNKFFALLLTSHEAGQRSMIAVQRLIDNLRPPDMTLDAVLKASTRDQLNKLAEGLRAAEARATLAWSDYLQILEVEQTEIEQGGRKIYPNDPLGLLPKFMKGHAGRQEILRAHMDKTFAGIAALNSARSNVAEFMASHLDQGRKPRPSGELAGFADQATNDQLKKLIASVRAAENNITKLDRGILNAEQNGVRTVLASVQ